MNQFLKSAAVVAAFLLASPALAANCALTYDTYEASVPHTDMETCPEGLGGEGLFCRLSIVAEVATIYVFWEETGCLMSTRTYEEDEFSVSFK